MTGIVDIAVVLPPRERFRDGDAGAVALTVRDFLGVSRYRERIVVLGGLPQGFAGVNYRRIPAAFHWLLGRNRAYARACAAWLRDNGIRLVEVHNRVALALALKRALPGCRVTLHIHNDPQGMKGLRTPAQRRQVLAVLDGIYGISEYVCARLRDGVDDARALAPVHVQHIALHEDAVAPAAQKRDWIVYAGRFIPEKGVLELAQALATVLPEFPRWRAVFLGAWGFGHATGASDYEKSVYAELARVPAQVEFRGHVPHAEVLQVLSEAAVSVVPSTGVEAFGRSLLEAMQAGCAVVASRAGALAEIGGDAVVALEPVSADALACALRELLAQPVRCAALGARGRERVETHFALPVQAALLDDARAILLGAA